MTTTRPVFVVDDDQEVLDSVRLLLQCDKHEVHCFQSAKKFLQQINSEQVGCLITDLGMPEMDGFELQEQLMAMRSMLSVIIVTGRANVGAAVRLMKNGAVTLLEKPYPADTLRREVSHSLDLSEKRAQRQRMQDSARKRLELLDEDEREVIALAAEGLPNKTISHRLALSSRTVDRRRQSAQVKLDVSSPAGYTKLLSLANDEDLFSLDNENKLFPKPPKSDDDDKDDDRPTVGMVLI